MNGLSDPSGQRPVHSPFAGASCVAQLRVDKFTACSRMLLARETD